MENKEALDMLRAIRETLGEISTSLKILVKAAERDHPGVIVDTLQPQKERERKG